MDRRPLLQPEELTSALAALIRPRRAAFRVVTRFAVALVEGPRFVIDTGRDDVVTAGWITNADVSILTTQQTLTDLVLGHLDVERPGPRHLLLWGGEARAWTALSKALSGGASPLRAQIAAMRESEK